jgi:hypothetical protein
VRQSDPAPILQRYGATNDEVAELVAYTENRFQTPDGPVRFPLEDEPHLEAWRRYAQGAETAGVFLALQQALVQLRFPVREGISHSEDYRAATLQGVSPDGLPVATGLQLQRPETLRLLLHPTAAGTVPVIIAPDREDFVALVRALGMHNEPGPVPPSMGATIIGGLNNWDRIAVLRAEWELAYPFGGASSWHQEMGRIIPRKELYQDRLILLSTGPYSGVPAEAMGLSGEEWLRLSLAIRLEHESTHYVTRRVFHSMRNNAFDELLADYVGITTATGEYRPDWLLRFMGLEGWPEYRSGGRLENYRGDPPLTQGAFRVLQAMTHDAALALARYPGAAFRPGDLQSSGEALLRLSALTLPELATASG